ncbi:hypothetical protein [Oscillibacter sp.]|uniref:hypothetical protein n=1 Tax=Oscillibacter sp. TaxID=1945593 RepID=UPI00289EBC6C|nr:hypothetical protein [Oscillibacter sp.]
MELQKEQLPIYYLVGGANLQGLPTFNLTYSGETGDNIFSRACINIMTRLCEEQWVKLWIGNGNNRNFLLPNEEKSFKKESFAQALQRTWREKEGVKLFFQTKKAPSAFLYKKNVLQDAMVFSKGVEQSILQAYLTKIQPEFHVCETFLLVYQNSDDNLNHYETVEEAYVRSGRKIFIQYGEMPDQMDITINSRNFDIE